MLMYAVTPTTHSLDDQKAPSLDHFSPRSYEKYPISIYVSL